jgi:FdhE protein
MPAKTTGSGDPVVQRLHELVRESPDLKNAALLYEAILPVLRDAPPPVSALSLTPEQVRGKMESGVALLADVELDLDIEAMRELLLGLAVAVEKADRNLRPHGLRMPWLSFSSEPGSSAGRIRVALEEGGLDAFTLLSCAAAGERGPVAAAAHDIALDPDLLWTLTQNAFKPALFAWRRELTPLAKDIPWNKDSCFVCGAAATLAELRENSQVKRLRCASCGGDWTARRLRCTACGNEDHRTLGYLYDDRNREGAGIEVCEECKSYLKIISSFSPTPAEQIPIEDLATLHLDYIAEKKGYTRATRFGPSTAQPEANGNTE